jgi:hypothetical protein
MRDLVEQRVFSTLAKKREIVRRTRAIFEDAPQYPRRFEPNPLGMIEMFLAELQTSTRFNGIIAI